VEKKGMNRTITLTLILTLIASSLATLQLITATSTPSVPQFTAKQVDRSYDAPTTYTTNPYTGETITHQGHYVANLTVEVTIKNQPIPTISDGFNTTGLFYNVQAKNHMDGWSSAYNDDRNKYTIKPSTSEYTIVTYILSSDELASSPGSQIDIRVQAVTGTEYTVWSQGGGMQPIGDAFNLDTASSWSSTQTITIGSGEVATSQPTTQPAPSQIDSNTTAKPTATQQEPSTQPDSGLQVSWEQVVIVVMAGVIAALVAALVLTRRKKQ
jgi:hypothetical protein